MNNLKYVELGEICEIVRGGSPRPIMDYITKDEDGVNWLKIGDVNETDKYFSHANEKIKQSGISKTRPVVTGDLILSNSMSYGRAFITLIDGYIHDGWLRLRCDESKVDKEYLYYFLISDFAQNQFRAIATGSVVNNLKADTVKMAKIALPSLKTQKIIASILSLFDDKIENNKAINRNLSELLDLMYKNDYLDEVVNHKDWIEVTMDDITSKFATGLNPRKNFVLGHGENYYVTIKNMNNNRVYLDSKCDMVDDDALVKINKRSDLQVGDLLFSGIGTIGRVHLIDEPPTNWNISESIFTMRPSKVVTSEFLYLLFLSYDMQDYALSLASGSVQKGIRMADLKRYKLYLPSKEDMDRLTSTWKPLIDQIKKFERENDELAILRDTLLRKLMSGELDVSNLDI